MSILENFSKKQKALEGQMGKVLSCLVAGTLCFGALLSACTQAPPVPTVTPTPAGPSATPTPTRLPTSTAVPTALPGSFFVDAAQDLGPISPLVYGTNYGPWLFVPLQMQDAAKAAGLTLIRFPGGNWGDLNDVEEWQIDQFFAFTRQMSTDPAHPLQPFIHVRLHDSTPEKAAELVRLVNITKGYGVRYWGIGNEPNYFEENTETYNQHWRQWAEAMRAVDPTILLVGPETDRFHPDPTLWPKDAAGRDWLIEFLKANGDLVDIVAVHRYPFPKNSSDGAPKIEDLRQSTKEWDEVIINLRGLVHEYTGRDLPVALTEVNSSWASNSGSEGSMDSHYNAIWWADSLGRLIRQNTYMVAQFCIIGELGLMGKYKVYPIYYVYQLYQRFGSERIYASSDQPDLSIYAARRADGALTLMVINLGLEETTYPLELAGFVPSGDAEVWRLDLEHNAEALGSLPLASGTQLSLPAQSVTLYVIPGK